MAVEEIKREDCVLDQVVTPAMAEEWLRDNRFIRQRPAMGRVVKRYASEMRRGEWGKSESKIVLGHLNDGVCLLNGQHRMMAIVQSGTSQTFTVEHRYFDTNHDMDMAYALMDRGAKRTAKHIIHALELSDTIGVPNHVLQHADASLRFILTGFAWRGGRGVSTLLDSPQSKERSLLRWQKEIYAYNSAFVGANRRVQMWFLRASVMSIALVTYRFSKEQAQGFWPRVCRNERLEPNTGEHRLYEFLASETVESKGEAVYCRHVINAWNAYYEERQLIRLYAKSATENVSIKGTPWNYNSQPDAVDIVLGKD